MTLGVVEMMVTNAPSFDPEWEVVHRQRHWGFLYDPRLITFIWRRFFTAPKRQDIRILDIGCGIGAQSIELARLGYNVVGVDASPSAISRAREIAPKQLLGPLKFVVGDVVEMNIRDHTFDVVVDACCLECLGAEHVSKVIRSIARGLKPNGALFSIHKASGWVQTVARVGQGSKTLTHDQIKLFYGSQFDAVNATLDSHEDCYGQTVPEWLIECTGPKR